MSKISAIKAFTQFHRLLSKQGTIQQKVNIVSEPLQLSIQSLIKVRTSVLVAAYDAEVNEANIEKQARRLRIQTDKELLGKMLESVGIALFGQEQSRPNDQDDGIYRFRYTVSQSGTFIPSSIQISEVDVVEFEVAGSIDGWVEDAKKYSFRITCKAASIDDITSLVSTIELLPIAIAKVLAQGLFEVRPRQN